MPKQTVAKPKRMSVEDLAVITAGQFERLENIVTEGFTEMRKGFVRIDTNFEHIDARLDTIRRDIADLDDLRERVQTIETHVGLDRKTRQPHD